MIFPFYWMIATAFKDTYAVYEYPPKIFPNPLVVSNFGKVWELLPFGQAFVNSIKIVLTVVVIQLLTASMAAFAFAKLQFKFRELIFLLVLATMMIPEQVIMIPLFQMFQKVGLIDTHLGLILPTAFCYPLVYLCLDSLLWACRIQLWRLENRWMFISWNLFQIDSSFD